MLHDQVIEFGKFLKYWMKLTIYSSQVPHLCFAKFNWKLICASCYLYLLIGNLNQNAYTGTFSNVNHEFKVKTFRN